MQASASRCALKLHLQRALLSMPLACAARAGSHAPDVCRLRRMLKFRVSCSAIALHSPLAMIAWGEVERVRDAVPTHP